MGSAWTLGAQGWLGRKVGRWGVPVWYACPCLQLWDVLGGTADAWFRHIAEFPTLADLRRHYDRIANAAAGTNRSAAGDDNGSNDAPPRQLKMD